MSAAGYRGPAFALAGVRWDCPEEEPILQRTAAERATSPQGGDVAVLHRTATVYPAADR